MNHRKWLRPALRISALVLFVAMLSLAERGWTQDDHGARALDRLRAVDVVEQAPAPDAETGIVSDDAGAQVAYASIVFYRAQHLLRFGQLEEGKALFREVVVALSNAIELSAHETDVVSRNLLRSQSANLLGDIYNYVYDDAQTATAFYEEALRYFPEHAAAEVSRNALMR